MQRHGPEKVEYIGHAVHPAWLLPHSKQLETYKLGNLRLQGVQAQGEFGKKLAPTGKIRLELSSNSEFQVWNWGRFLELRLVPVVLKAL